MYLLGLEIKLLDAFTPSNYCNSDEMWSHILLIVLICCYSLPSASTNTFKDLQRSIMISAWTETHNTNCCLISLLLQIQPFEALPKYKIACALQSVYNLEQEISFFVKNMFYVILRKSHAFKSQYNWNIL